jgi:hypothetical protein
LDERPLPVSLADRIAWQWYLAAAAIPLIGQLIGAIAGIVFMARSKIGPALALWATALLAGVIWTAIAWGVVFAWAWGEASDSSADVPALIEEAAERESSQATPEPESNAAASEPDPAPTADETQQSDGALSACGNLQVSADSVRCGFANNVFYEYWSASEGGTDHAGAISAYSPSLGRWLDVQCEQEDRLVCVTGVGGEVHIPYDALDEYTQAAADEYAASHTVSDQ